MKKNNQRPSKIFPIFIGTIVCVVFILNIYFSHKERSVLLNYEFNGLVENVSYSIKGKATILIKGIHYDLNDNNWDFDHNRIEKGDSIIKKKNSMMIKLIKRNGKIIIEDSK